MNLDLRTTKTGGTWVPRFGAHEQGGFGVSIGEISAHVQLATHRITFAVDRDDVPSAWAQTIDVVTLRTELIATVLRKMSPEILEEILRELSQEIRHQYQAGLRDGAQATRTKILGAIGL